MMAQEFSPLATREQGAYPLASVTSVQRGQRTKEPARMFKLLFRDALERFHFILRFHDKPIARGWLKGTSLLGFHSHSLARFLVKDR